jgi:nucleotide-binding universal stress UspA family protein
VIDLIPRVLGVRRILVPVDFSEPSAKALRYAVSFARQFDARITLLHVCPVPYYPAEFGGFPTIVPVDEPPTKAIKHRLEENARRFIPEPMRGRTLLRTGAAFDEICRAARDVKADLIIIATHGHTGLKHVLLGSTAERVVRHAHCPVLVVRKEERDFA